MPIKNKNITPEQARARLMAICARSEQCTYQLRQKLWKWGIPGNIADSIINDLEKGRYVDDIRFARAFVHDKLTLSGWGERKVTAALTAYRIPSSVVRDLIQEIDSDIIEANLLKILRNKAKLISDPFTYDGRTRMFRYAISRGYRPEIVSKLIKEHFLHP